MYSLPQSSSSSCRSSFCQFHFLMALLTANETVNKLLLDPAYRALVCESGTPRGGITYPGIGPGRTVAWPDLAMCVAAALGQTDDETPMTVELPSAEGTVRP